MRYALRHATTYAYRRRVELGSHLAHLLPRPLPGRQAVSASRLEISPAPSFLREERDWFGNRIAWFTVEGPHDRFEVVAVSEVEVRAPPPPDAGSTPAWDRIARALRDGAAGAGEAAAEWEAFEFTRPSPRLPASPAAAAYARDSFPAGRPVLEGLVELNRRIHADFRFDATATDLRTTVGELLGLRRGVCQDFSHLMIAALRGLGLPARYASGYIRTYPAPGAEKRAGSDVSHAWVEAWLGPARGWIGLDPTNDIVVADEHVQLGWGRDFSDVSPLFGVILGGGAHRLEVSVDLRALE